MGGADVYHPIVPGKLPKGSGAPGKTSRIDKWKSDMLQKQKFFQKSEIGTKSV